MTDIVERPWYHHLGQSERAEVERMADEIERLRTRLAIQFGMHPGGDLAKAAQAEIERQTAEAALNQENTKRLLEGMEAEIERLRAALNELWQELAYMDGDKPHRLCGIAKRALEPKP